jgi:glycosyltransferase involved in cell wall biosynthesis
MERSHILFLASWYPNRHAPALGNFIREHARAAAIRHTISVIYVCSDENMTEGEMELETHEEGTLTAFMLYYGKIKSRIPFFSSIKKRNTFCKTAAIGINKAIEKNGPPALLHLHVIWPMANAIFPFLKTNKIPFLISEHWSGYLPEDGNYKGFAMKWISSKAMLKAQLVTVVSARMQAAMLSHGLENHYVRLPNPVNTAVFFHAPEKQNKAGIHLLHVSMLVDREKNISGLLRVMKSLEDRPDIQLEIIGDGPERDAHEKLAENLGLLNKTVFFSGYKNANEIAAAMQAANALLMFSHYEGMPVTIIEAQSCGLPVIASGVGAIPEMVLSQEGYLVKSGEEAELKKAILHFSESGVVAQPAEISRRARQQYSYEAVGQLLDQLYHSLTENHGH